MDGGKRKCIIHCCVGRDTYELLKAHCARTGQTKTTAVRRAIAAYCAGGREGTDDAGRTGDTEGDT